ncbi:cytochrome P450 [Salinactinospora qingdaonensis]|uniref:Cytochrome P450 n=1 Tax=Salinactinospora qingdaonensis TaxID=702744 RepID=A0ABP7GFH5_9ACTN
MPLYAAAQSGEHDSLWEELRARYGAVAPVEILPGVSGWLLLGYHENLDALRDRSRFSADPSRCPYAHNGQMPQPSAGQSQRTLAGDGPEHRRLRAPIVDALTRLHAPKVTETINRIASELIDNVATKGTADLIGEYAAPLPALVLNQLFGLDDEYGRLLADLSATLWDGDPESVQWATNQIHAYFAALVARKRASPGNDITSWLLEHPSNLTDKEAAEELTLMWAAGHEPTTHLIGNALRRLLADPEITAAYGGVTLPAEDFIDYVMWVDPPLQTAASRFSAHDLRLGEADIKAGEALLLGFAPAHADPAVSAWQARDVMALAGNRAHLMWGAGAHGCPAQSLAREITTIAIDTVVNQLTNLHLAVDPQRLRWRSSLSVHGLVELPVEFHPRESAQPAEDPQPQHSRKRIFRKRHRAPSRGARYGAPGAAEKKTEPTTVVRAPRTAQQAPPSRGARYGAPAAATQAAEPSRDALDHLLASWRDSKGG